MVFRGKGYGLRGSHAKNFQRANPATLQNQINRLRLDVSANRPETKYHRVSNTHSSTGVINELITYNITNNLLTSSTFRDQINGDRWTNKYLNVRMMKHPDCTHLRVMIYVPKKPGESFTPSLVSGTCFVQQPDPNKYWVLRDDLVNTYTTDGFVRHNINVSLKKLKTIINTAATDIEKGEIKMLVVYNGQTAATPQFDYSWKLTFNDN